MPSPTKLSHLVLQTNQIAAMREWYFTVLEAELVQESDLISFISYDEEHHRVAFLNPGPLTPKGDADVGINHIAFSYASLGDLVTVYERLKRAGIVPHWCINHGPTTSALLQGPGRQRGRARGRQFIKMARRARTSCARRLSCRNQRGAQIDPDDLGRRLRAGEPERVLPRTRHPREGHRLSPGPRGAPCQRARRPV